MKPKRIGKKEGESRICYRFRIYPNKEQREKLDYVLEICRQAYNILLGELQDQVVIDKNMIQAILPDLKICEPRFKEVYAKTLQYECYRLFSNLSTLSAIKKKGRKVGRLKFKGKDWFKTINYNQSGFKLDRKNKRLKLSKIGDIKIKLHREVEGKIKHITIKKSINKWYASIITDYNLKRKKGKGWIGLDVGIKNYLTDSNGNKINFSKDKYLKEQRKQCESLSRKKEKSNNWNKQKLILQKFYEKISENRKDFLHKLSDKYVEEYKYIVVENLNINEMVNKDKQEKKDLTTKVIRGLNRNIHNAAWNMFFQMLEYKLKQSGGQLIKVDPKNTTQMCSKCGEIKKGEDKLKLKDRIYKCNKCGFELDRDYNAALNILERGKKQKV